MPTALVATSDGALARCLETQFTSIPGWKMTQARSVSEAQHAITTNGVKTMLLDFRQNDFEAEVIRLLDWLESEVEISVPRIAGLTEQGYHHRSWRLVDRFVAEHFHSPDDLTKLGRCLAGRNGANGFALRMPSEFRELRANGLSFRTETPALFSVLDQLSKVSGHDVTLLFVGETGTGKSHLAHLVHSLSPRKEGPLFATSCGALPPDLIESELFGHVKGAFTTAVRSSAGRFEAARGGTLLLDEIDVLGPKEQSKLLRVIETGKYEPVGSTDTKTADVRLIVASNVDLKELVRQNKFRTDLYYRLNILEFCLLPLRDRPNDILPLAKQFIDESSKAHEIRAEQMAPSFLQALRHYHWPGNIRELQNQMRRAVLFCSDGVLTADSLSVDCNLEDASQAAPASQQEPVGWNLINRMAHTEKEFLEETLRAHNNNRAATARALGISRTALYKKLHRFGLMASNGDDEAIMAEQAAANREDA